MPFLVGDGGCGLGQHKRRPVMCREYTLGSGLVMDEDLQGACLRCRVLDMPRAPTRWCSGVHSIEKGQRG